jgi:hypothetical protein
MIYYIVQYKLTAIIGGLYIKYKLTAIIGGLFPYLFYPLVLSLQIEKY